MGAGMIGPRHVHVTPGYCRRRRCESAENHEGEQPAMIAHVSTWEGGTAEGIRAAAEEIRSNLSLGPPAGLKSTGLTMLVDPEGGRVLMIGLFATEADLRESEPVLEQMNPPEGLGSRTAVDIYEVGAEARL